MILVGFFLLHRDAVFRFLRYFLTANVSLETPCLALSLVRMHSAAASTWALTKFSYSSFGVSALNISWRSWHFFIVIVYSLLLSVFFSGDQSQCVVLAVCVVFRWRLTRIFSVTILGSLGTPSKEEYASLFKALLIHFWFMRM